MASLTQVLGDAHAVATAVVRAEADKCDRKGAWPRASMHALQEAGLGGLVVPEEHGGHGLGMEALARVCEALGRECGSTGLCFGMHTVGTAVLASKATEDHVQRYLRPIAEGRHLTTLALSEPGTGVHFYLPETKMARDGKEYVVDGRKSFVTNGGQVDSYVVSGLDPAARARTGAFSCIMLPRAAPGMSWVDPWQGVGMRGNSSCGLVLDGVRVPEKDRLGREGDQNWYVFQVVAPYFLMAMAGTYLGIAARALDEATAHLKERRHGHTGRPLAGVDVLQHRLGALWTDVERARRFIHWAAREGDTGGPGALHGIMAAKADVARCAVATVNECMTLCGGRAYAEGALLERLLRDARAAHVMSPTTDLLLNWIGRRLLDRPMLEE